MLYLYVCLVVFPLGFVCMEFILYIVIWRVHRFRFLDKIHMVTEILVPVRRKSRGHHFFENSVGAGKLLPGAKSRNRLI